MTIKLVHADSLAWMRIQTSDRFNLVCGSPPYVDCRTYGIGAQRGCVEWIEWMLAITEEAARICRGPVIWVAAGATRKRNYWPACEGLMYEWWKRGGTHELYRPCIFHRVGIPGSGGDDWFRADTEYIMCFKRPGALPWSDNTAHGHKPKWAPGGEMSYRNSAGTRRNQWGAKTNGSASRDVDGNLVLRQRPSHVVTSERDQVEPPQPKTRFGHDPENNVKGGHSRDIVAIANPGNVWKIKVGGGLMGNRLCHENEAPFPEALAERIVLATCPPGGWVLDPFIGSGTTAEVCQRFNRNCVGVDIRESQIDLSKRRCAEVQPMLF